MIPILLDLKTESEVKRGHLILVSKLCVDSMAIFLNLFYTKRRNCFMVFPPVINKNVGLSLLSRGFPKTVVTTFLNFSLCSGSVFSRGLLKAISHLAQT
jgi:hypothetical protein